MFPKLIVAILHTLVWPARGQHSCFTCLLDAVTRPPPLSASGSGMLRLPFASELLPLPRTLPFQIFWNFCKREWKHLAINFHICTKLLVPLDLYAVTPNPTQKACFIKNSAWATPQRAPTWLELLLWLLRASVSAWHWPRLCYRVLWGSRLSLQGRAHITLLFPGDAHPKHFISMQRPLVTGTGPHCFSAKWLTSDFLPKYPFLTQNLLFEMSKKVSKLTVLVRLLLRVLIGFMYKNEDDWAAKQMNSF